MPKPMRFQRKKDCFISIIYGGFVALLLTFPALAHENNLTHENSKSVTVETQSQYTPTGRKTYLSHCALCHGLKGKGDGRMALLINNPPPFNLTQSTRPANYLRVIISHGGASVRRSEQMPAWNEELNEAEIETLITYLLSLRNKQQGP